MGRVTLIACWAGALLAATAGCSAEDPGPPPACQPLERAAAARQTSLVLVLNDTMRRDRLGAYGGPARTPNFDRFARDAVLFRRAFSPAPWTRPSIASLFTSLHPSQHGLIAHPSDSEQGVQHLARGFTTLAEALRAAGYRTAAFVANPWMTPRFGFAQGFDRYDVSLAEWDAPGVAVATDALDWLDAQPQDSPFFLYVHTMDAHRPYPALRLEELEAHAERIARDPGGVGPEAYAKLRGLVQIEGGDALTRSLVTPSRTLLELAYEKGIERFDRALGVLLAGIAASDHDPAIVVTSDHGEALFDRGYGNHGTGLYDDEIAVPLAAHLPGVESASGAVDCAVSLLDLMPTLCSYLDVDCPDGFGVSWLRDDGPAPPRYLVAEGVSRNPRHRAVRGAAFKLLWEPDSPAAGPRASPYALYDLVADPGERRDLLESEPARYESAFAHLRAALHTSVPEIERPPAPRVPIGADDSERLRALGYLQADDAS